MAGAREGKLQAARKVCDAIEFRIKSRTEDLADHRQ